MQPSDRRGVPKASAGHGAQASVKCQWEEGALGMRLCKQEAGGLPGPIQAPEASSCGPSDGFYAGGLCAEGTEVAKGEQNRALAIEVSATEKTVSPRAFILHHGCRVSTSVPSDRPLHKGNMDDTPEVTTSRCQQTRCKNSPQPPPAQQWPGCGATIS